MRRIPIRIKVMAALALPLAALTLVTLVEVREAVREEQDVSHEARLARAATGPNGLFTNLQNERNRATVDLVGQGDLIELEVEDNATARRATDRSLEEFRDVVDEQGGAAERAYAPALSRLSELEEIRQAIDSNPGPYTLEANSGFSGEIFAQYTDIVGELLASNQKLSSGIENEELRRGADLSYMASLQQDLLARLTRTLLLSVPNGGLNENTEIQEASGLLQLATRNFEDMQTVATGDYAPLAEQLVQAEQNRGLLEQIAPAALATGQVDAGALLASVSQSDEDAYLYDFRDGVKTLLDEKADEVDGDASRRRSLFLAFGVLVLGLAVLATWLVSRSITRPLRALTRQAAEMANRKLPEAVQGILDTPLGDDVTVAEIDPITVQTRDEVADVSAALNTVQDSALQLAVEQAVLRRNIADSFVNLGRRNQNLLSRQLDFITELERNETDPEVLADLFRLDHLATRMRRNAESLLVLAGIEPPRQWAAPVRIDDVVRAALGEVEGYQRVTVRAVEPVTVQGSVAADLAHIVAELVENALVFSSEDQSVEVRGRLQAAGVGSDYDAYTLAIIDYGMGMPPEELDRANRRLGGAESFTVAPSKYLGHYVAGNLAARHGIVITLHNSPGNGSTRPGHAGSGITALVRLPASLLTSLGDGAELEEDAALDESRELVGVGAAVAPAAPADSGRTASGLARRTRRSTPAAQPFAPPSELIDALAQHTSLASDPLQPIGDPPAPPLPPTAWAPPPPHQPPAWPDPPPPAATPAWTVPLPQDPPPAPEPWSAPDVPPLQARRPAAEPPGGLDFPGPQAFQPAPEPPTGPGLPPLPARRPTAEPAGESETTASGLVRRVRGAQLPTTETVSLRRGPGTQEPEVPPPPPPPEQLGSLLGDFTAGIQRGLDEARDDDEDS